MIMSKFKKHIKTPNYTSYVAHIFSITDDRHLENRCDVVTTTDDPIRTKCSIPINAELHANDESGSSFAMLWSPC